MDDQFLYDFRENPSPEFADKLRRKLNAQAASELRATRQSGEGRRWWR